MTDRLNDLTHVLKILIQTRDTIREIAQNLTPDDKACILGPMSDAISDCEYLMKEAYES